MQKENTHNLTVCEKERLCAAGTVNQALKLQLNKRRFYALEITPVFIWEQLES